MPILTEEDVLWLEIPVDDIETMEVAEGSDSFCKVEDCGVETKSGTASEIREKFSTQVKIYHDVENNPNQILF